MFGYEDRRTDKERQRDLEWADRRATDELLAIGFISTALRPMLKNAGVDVGLAGKGSFGSAELLCEVDGVTYKISVCVDHNS